MVPSSLQKFWQSLPPLTARIAGHTISFGAGLLIALILHYVLYRISLPGTPFIYVVF